MLKLTLLLCVLCISINNAYQVFGEASFYDADLYCSREYGVHLVSIHNEETNNKIGNLLYDAVSESYGWIGLDQQTDTWTDSTPFDYNPGFIDSFHEVCTAIFASPTTPNDDNKWIAEPCAYEYPFICNTRIAGDYDALLAPDIPLIRIKFTSANDIQVIWAEEADRESGAIGEYFDPINGEEYGTGYMYFPDDRSYDIYYYPNENTIYWDGLKGETNNIWVKHNGCLHYGSFVANECSRRVFEFDFSIGYYCIDTNTIEKRYFNGTDCNPGKLTSSYIQECNSLYCNCGAISEEECLSVDLITLDCFETSSPAEISNVIIDKCATYFETTSSRYVCDGNELILEYYADSIDCSGESLNTIYNDECHDGIAYQSTCYGSTTSEPDVEPSTTLDILTSTSSTLPHILTSSTTELDGDCLHYAGFPVNECSSYYRSHVDSLPTEESTGYYCVDESTVEYRIFDGKDCNPNNQRNTSYTLLCEFGTNCNCNDDEYDECEPITIEWESCDTDIIDMEGYYSLLIDRCTRYHNIGQSFEYFCDGEILTQKRYTNNTNCDGDFEQTIYHSSCDDEGSYLSWTSTCSGSSVSTTSQPSSTSIPVDNCPHYAANPVNECIHYLTETDTSMGYYCIDSSTIEKRYFSGSECQNEPISFDVLECEPPLCNCNENEDIGNECSSIVSISTGCDTAKFTMVEANLFIKDVCFVDFSTTSYKYVCNDDNELVLEYYTHSIDCSGDPLDTLYSNECDSNSDWQVAYYSSCSFESEMPLMSTTLSPIGSMDECLHFNGSPANECLEMSSLGESSYGYYCIDENTMEPRVFTGEDCDPNNVISSTQTECDGYNCNCKGDTCESVILEYSICPETESYYFSVIINKCQSSEDESYSYFYYCDGDVLTYKSISGNSHCIGEGFELAIHGTCEDGDIAYSSTCSLINN
jgi:hypothetical protein